MTLVTYAANAGWIKAGQFKWSGAAPGGTYFSCLFAAQICIDCSNCSGTATTPAPGDKAILKTPSGDVPVDLVSFNVFIDEAGNAYELIEPTDD